MLSKEVDKLIDLCKKNKLAHVYLIETNNQIFCVEELLSLVKALSCNDIHNNEECYLCNSITKKEALNFFYIEPDGKNIKKEQIADLKSKCSKMPFLAKNNVYIIKEAEKLNNYSANTLLKFIEEPEDNLYGFFITNSKDNVINTIKSRCEIINIRYSNLELIDELNISKESFFEYLDNVLKYLYAIEVEKNDSILYNKIVLDEEMINKESLNIVFKIIFDIYCSYFNKDYQKYKEFIFLKELSLENLLAKQKILVNIINNINYNLNLDLLLDKFIIEIGEIND